MLGWWNCWRMNALVRAMYALTMNDSGLGMGLAVDAVQCDDARDACQRGKGIFWRRHSAMECMDKTICELGEYIITSSMLNVASLYAVWFG